MATAPTSDPLREMSALTKRQREVLALAAKGLTNPEIGDRLGISKDGAKWHIGEILMRLDVDTREEAVDLWRRYNGLPYRLHRSAREIIGTTAVRWVVGGAGTAAVAGLAVALVVLVLQGNTDSQADVTPPAAVNATASPAATPTTESLDGIPVVAAHVGAATTLPEGTVAYMESGCTGCENPARSIDRVIVGADGQAQEQTVYTVAGADSSGISPDNKFISSIAASTNGYGLVVGVCENGACGKGGWKDTDQVTYFASNDGGMTWQPIGTITGNSMVIAVETVGATITTAMIRQQTLQSGDAKTSYVTLPGNNPSTTTRNPDGSMWLKSGGNSYQLLIGPDGEELVAALNTAFTVTPDLPPKSHITGAWNSPNGFVVSWISSDSTTFYVGMMGLDDNKSPRTTGKPQSAVRWTQPDIFSFNGAMLDRTHALMTIGMPASEAGAANTNTTVSEPVVVDLKTGVMQPLGTYFQDRAKTGDRSNIIAVTSGPFAEVHDAGDCLNVRASASTSAESLGCYKDGVLLRQRGITLDAEGRTWLAVSTPLNSPGWAAADYLQPISVSTSVAGYPATTRTGNPDIDPVLAAIESGDGAKLIAVTQFTSETCEVDPHRIGAVYCPAGVANGSTIEVIPSGGCEGSAIPKVTFETSPNVPGVGMELYAIYASGDGSYVLMFTNPKTGLAESVSAKAGRLIRLWGGCGQTTAQVLAQQPNKDFVLPPK